MKIVRSALELFEGEEGELPISYQKIGFNVMWDVKLVENFRRRDKFVAGGHKTITSTSLTYSSVV